MLNVCVFCGSRTGDRSEFVTSTEMLGRYLSQPGHTVIYGGGSTGIMGILADTVLSEGGQIIGIITRHLARPELMHAGVQDMRITADMHERKAMMHALSDVYVALPGGFGTMEEFFEATTWAQLELHTRPVAILNSMGLYDGLVQMMDQMVERGFLSQRCRSLVAVFTEAAALCEWLSRKAESAGKPG